MHTQATQQDHNVRVVALENLRAMCDRISGTCHRFTVTKVTANRVHVSYSNPDEYGCENPVTAIFPAWASTWPGDAENPRVALDAVKYVNSPDEEWQAFETLYDCPILWRNRTANNEKTEWRSEYEILVARNPGFAVESKWDAHGCIQTHYYGATAFRSLVEAQSAAVVAMKDYEDRTRNSRLMVPTA